jgi:nucleotide-binding universal stress UspA family protein
MAMCGKSENRIRRPTDAVGDTRCDAGCIDKEGQMFETIVWATDGSTAADRALPYAKSLAEGVGKELVVVHANELMVGRAGGYPVLADEDFLETKIRAQVDEIRREGLDVRLEVVRGAAGKAGHMIADAAAEVGADVIIVGTRGHGPVAGLVLGSVTQRLLHIARCPVLAVPDRDRQATPRRERESIATG